MKNKHPKKIIALLFSLVLIAWPARIVIVADGPLFSLAQTAPASGPYDYTPLETLPGFESETSKPVDFYNYISMVYQVGIWSIGMLSMFMIIFGGYMYITAAGNNSEMGKAKSIITDAIIGLLLALVSYLVLYVINPDLIKLQRLEPGAQTQQAEDQANAKYDGKYPVIQSKLPQNCNDSKWQTIFNEVAREKNMDKCILMAAAAKESGCNQQPARTENGRDCSVMQIAASLHCKTTCDDLEQNPKKAVACAADYLRECSAKWRKNPNEQLVRDIYAGYNGGCGALDKPRDCPAPPAMINSLGNRYVKWDCPINPGEYKNVPARTSTFLDYYRQCKGS